MPPLVRPDRFAFPARVDWRVGAALQRSSRDRATTAHRQRLPDKTCLLSGGDDQLA
jgi:hypothetical protein